MTDDELATRLAALEARVAELAVRIGAEQPASHSEGEEPRSRTGTGRRTVGGWDAERFWGVAALEERYEEPGAVSFAGSVDVGLGHIDHQWERPASDILDRDWAERADRLAALAHPLRLAIVRLLLDEPRTVAQLVDELDLASTGVAYHHLNQLQGSGWVTSPRRGVWAIPNGRIVPIMTIVIALDDP